MTAVDTRAPRPATSIGERKAVTMTTDTTTDTTTGPGHRSRGASGTPVADRHGPADDLLFPSRVAHWARTRPDAPACTYVDHSQEREGVERTWTYAALDHRARVLARAVSAHAGPGDRVAIVLPQGLDYLAAFLACQYAGVIGVPLHAPDIRQDNSKLTAVLADCAPAATLTEQPLAELVADLAEPGMPGSGTVLTVEEAGRGEPQDPRPLDPHAPAYLQYTSGSTRRPAGVVVTHDNLRVATAQLRSFTRLGTEETQVSWLPFFHDMGLVLGASMPLSAGAHGVYMAPYAFVHRPVRWLELISRHRARTSASPNFGLDFAVSRVTPEQREGLDLSSLRHVVNGAEPIRAASLHRFTDTYRPHGFDPAAHCPGYGLAEATLAVTLGSPQGGAVTGSFDRDALNAGKAVPVAQDTPGAVSLVACGQVWEQHVAVADPGSGEALADGAVGEVWVAGPNVCDGYWERPEETARTFGARLPAGSGTGGGFGAEGPVRTTATTRWLRTGDLGFLHDGQLYVTARLKDLIIVRGANHYPVDLESTVEAALPEARVGHVAAFSVDTPGTDGEGVVIVCELDARRARELDTAAALRTIRLAVQARHRIEVHDVVLTRQGKVPKTTSGKVQRRACRDRYLAGGLDPAVARHRTS